MDELVIAKPGAERKNVLDAKKNYQKIMEEIKPFIKERKIKINPKSKWEINMI